VTPEPLVPREELEAALAARRELGPEREPEVVDAFLDRVERQLERRIAERSPVPRDERGFEQRRFALGLISVACGIPLTAIALGTSGLAALVVVWVGIVLVNVVFARSRG
jgi:Flp pilus assembly protein TadB